MRLLRGEDLESVSRAVGITAARASHWRAQFLAAGQAGLKSRAPGGHAGRHRFLNVLPHLDTPPARTLSQSSVQENPRAQEKYTTKYRVGNWPTYARALVQRGYVTLWLSAVAIDTWRPSPSASE